MADGAAAFSRPPGHVEWYGFQRHSRTLIILTTQKLIPETKHNDYDWYASAPQ